MTTKPIKVPGHDHPITIEANPSRVLVLIGGRIIADSREALTLRETKYQAVQYIPRKDVDMSLLQRTDHATYCPYKGDCAYYSIPLGGEPQPMRSGPTRLLTPLLPRLRVTSPSIPIASTR
jgi:uncharacterized protein (DUF427 family)